MGIIRLYLAASVVLAHSSSIHGYFGIPSFAAVTLFFVISGFYMGMIGTEKYIGPHRFSAFYSNRFLRLYPTYLLALVIAILAKVTFNAGWTSLTINLLPEGMALTDRFLVGLTNLTMLGSDLLFLFHHSVQSGWHFTFGMNPPDLESVRTGQYLLVAPVWSIGLELWFYLLVPFIVKWRSTTLMAVGLGSLGLRAWMELRAPWSTYFFFPANLGFFLIGILSYRFYRCDLYRRLATIKVLHWVYLSTLALMIFRQYIPGYRNYAWPMYMLFALAIPFLFHASRASLVDRWIGNLSYPLYILHGPVLHVFDRLHMEKSGSVVFVVSLAISCVALALIDQPLDRIRQRRFAAALANQREIGD